MTDQGSHWRRIVKPDEHNLFDALQNRGAKAVPVLAAAALDNDDIRRINMDAVAPNNSKPMSLRTTYGFPTDRRPQLRKLTDAPQDAVNDWFEDSGITIGTVARTKEQQGAARRLLYTWKDCFAKSLKEIRPTDLIHHSIDLKPNAIPVYKSAPRYTPREKEFAATVFPEMEEAGIILRAASEWGSRTKFPPKKKGSELLRVVHNFIPLNLWTIKPQWPMHRIEDVVDTVIQPRFKVWFSSDASNSYWAILIKPGDEYKTGIITPNGQYIYLRMGQGLKGACATYSQFGDIVFGPLPKTAAQEAFPSLIGQHEKCAFTLFMDDHMAAGETFESLFDFLHTKYFPRVSFGPIYLAGHKTHVFTDTLEMVGFTGGVDGLRPAAKHRNTVRDWKPPTCKEEVEAILYLTPFLRLFIPGRADHALCMKKSYMREEAKALTDGKESIRKQWVEKESFDWGPEQQASFEHIKRSISENVMSGADDDLQFHLATDASKYCLGGVLFQLPGIAPGVEAIEKHKNIYKIVMFMSFRLEEAEVRYGTTEREALAVVRCLAESKCFVMGHRYPTMLYSDHEALKSVLKNGPDEHFRISRWMDRLTEYDYIIHHRPSKSNIMGIADGMSRMPGRYNDHNILTEDLERLGIAAATTPGSTSSSTGPVNKTHQAFRASRWYGTLTSYLLDGFEALKDTGTSEAKRIKRQAFNFAVADQHLLYLERNGTKSKCILPAQIDSLLKWAHDEHGHFSVAITLHKLIGQWYWPTRASDVERYCHTCHICQLEGPRKKSTTTQSIINFEPFAMVGMDFLGPIKPTCSVTGAKYVLIVVDYFSRFVWAQTAPSANQAAVHDFWIKTLAPIYGFPQALYTDNGSHFAGSETISLFETHGTRVTFAPISHPSSVGLVERNVQLVMAQIRRWVNSKGTEARNFWGVAIPQIMPNINGRLLRIHGYTPAEILMGFNPKWNVDEHLPDNKAVDVTMPKANLQYWEEKRRQLREGATLSLARHHNYLEAKQNAAWTSPQPGDLVMVRDLQKEKEYGRKLDPNWLGPRLLVMISPSKVSGYVKELYGENTKRYHLDDLKVYCRRTTTSPATAIERGAMLHAGYLGQRAVDLNSPAYFS